MEYAVKEKVTYTIELTKAEAITIGLALDALANSFPFKCEEDADAIAEFSMGWDEMIDMDDYDRFYQETEE